MGRVVIGGAVAGPTVRVPDALRVAVVMFPKRPAPIVGRAPLQSPDRRA
jgi:hypothetical protein